MKIILKADDLAGYPGKKEVVPQRWQRFVDIIEKYKIKATIGVIGNSLLFDDVEYFDWIKHYHREGIIEFWNHGFLHRQFNFENEVYQEFKDTSVEYQMNLINYTNQLAQEKLGFGFKTFGAPYNAIDENTSIALDKTIIDSWFFGKDSFEGKVLSNRLDIEKPTHIVNPNYLKENWNLSDYTIIQVHPNNWNNKSFELFEESIKYILSNDCKFILSMELA